MVLSSSTVPAHSFVTLNRPDTAREDFTPGKAPLAFLLDVDNTLLDNDRFAADLSAWLTARFGEAEQRRYWSLYEELRRQLGYADYLSAAQQFRAGLEQHPYLLELSRELLEYPFADRLFPQVHAVLSYLRSIAPTAILSDGDVIFQPRKIQRSGLWQALDGQVFIYIHKERMLDCLQQRFPAPHYVMVDDKAAILASMKQILGPRLTTVWVRQGHYAADAGSGPPPDLSFNAIADLLTVSPSSWLPTHSQGSL